MLGMVIYSLVKVFQKDIFELCEGRKFSQKEKRKEIKVWANKQGLVSAFICMYIPNVSLNIYSCVIACC